MKKNIAIIALSITVVFLAVYSILMNIEAVKWREEANRYNEIGKKQRVDCLEHIRKLERKSYSLEKNK
jgi:hypothetical protein